ncbi:hypothetical protein COO55_32425 [Rhodococcus opacus]|nr:ribonuclease H-like domain-containing protein [Rhodococcus opacus]RKM76277.1 hypothetical protein COO55_32425 [Rhodococcus opacus]
MLCDKKSGILTSIGKIEQWRAHGEVYMANKPRILPGTHAPIPAGYIALDLEHEEEKTTAAVWTFCARAVGVANPRQLTIFADETHQADLLAQLADFLAAYPDLPVISWSQSDIRVLRKAVTEISVENQLIGNLTETRHHTDLLEWTKGAMILPTKSLDLKTVAAYFGIANDVPSMNGSVGSARMRAHRSTTNPSVKKGIRAELIRYVRSDVTLLVGVADHLRSIHDGITPPTGRHEPLHADDVIYI